MTTWPASSRAALDWLVPAAVGQVMRRIDINELVEKYVDVEGLVAGMDLAAVTNQVMAQIDLPEIIRAVDRGGRVGDAPRRPDAGHLGRRRGGAAGRPAAAAPPTAGAATAGARGPGDDVTAGAISPIPREARGYQGEPAGLVTRLLAACIDVAVIAAVLVAAWAGLNGLRFMIDPRGFQSSGISAVVSVTASIVVAIAYLTVAWSTTGRSWGDHVMGLRVVTRAGGRVRLPVAFLRAVTCTVFPIGLLWCAASRTRGAVQDIVFRTCVVYDWMPRRDA